MFVAVFKANLTRFRALSLSINGATTGVVRFKADD